MVSYEEVGLYYSSTSKGLVGFFLGGPARLAMWGSEKARSKDLTKLMVENGFNPVEHLSGQFLAFCHEHSVSATTIADSPITTSAIDAWKFEEFSVDAAAVIYLQINEIAFSNDGSEELLPMISATLTAISTKDNQHLGEMSYYIRLNHEPTDQRDLIPLKEAGFADSEQLLTRPARAVEVIRAELDRIAALMVYDIASLRNGQELAWGKVNVIEQPKSGT